MLSKKLALRIKFFGTLYFYYYCSCSWCAFAGGVGAGYFASLVKDEPVRSYEGMKKDIYNYEETSELYFANDVYLGKLYRI